ncbi:MAG TPA: hypothetical protein VNV43_03905 [Candidatus Acidoferrales bacterium]|nr:hypothetical protein [Candidatus Acidoferrales bacterium]
MNIQNNLICICAVALLAGPGVISPLRAQSGERRVENRLLLVFDTSSAMKRRVPDEIKAINALFEITLNGRLRYGDSVGVWTFGRDLHLGQFPQQEWTEDKINTLPPELAAFLKKQHYSKDTHFDALIPTLNEVVRTSPRLTAVIFCDGDGHVSGIPGADSINTNFKGHQRDMERARMPFVIVLRSQLGRYVGCTISSAESVTLPQFPPLPPPPAAPAPIQTSPHPPAPVGKPLIVIGTHTETNPTTTTPPRQQTAPVIPAPVTPAPMLPLKPNVSAAPAPPAVIPAPSVPISETNVTPIPPPATRMQPTNATIVPPQAQVRPPPPAAAQAMPPESTGTSTVGLIAAGAGLFIVAIAILFFILRRARGRNSASLITESLKKDKIHS